MLSSQFILLISSYLLLTASVYGSDESKPGYQRHNTSGYSQDNIEYNLSLKTYYYQVAILLKDTILCSGIIVNEKIVLTSAGCVYKKPFGQLSILAGTNKLSEHGQIRGISEIIPHPQFKPATMKNDLALLILNETLKLGFGVERAVFDTKLINIMEFVDITGWGSTSVDLDYPDYLMVAGVKVISNERCAELWSSINNVTIYPTNFCTHTEAKGACDGDAGGPVTSNSGKVIGVISYFGHPCATLYPDVHTRIQPYLKWIKENSASIGKVVNDDA